jgi:quercetin dioxygenase-like cupin family protein
VCVTPVELLMASPIQYPFRSYIPYRSRTGGPAARSRATVGKGSAEPMQKLSLDALAREQLEAARRATAGRAAQTVFGGHEHVVRQTVIAVLRGRSLAEHVNPGEATVHVLRGRVRLATTDTASWDGRQGDLIVVPQVRREEMTARAGVCVTGQQARRPACQNRTYLRSDVPFAASDGRRN